MHRLYYVLLFPRTTPGGGIRAPGRVPRGVFVVRDAPEVGRNPRPGDLVSIFPEKSFANQGLRLGVRVVLDI